MTCWIILRALATAMRDCIGVLTTGFSSVHMNQVWIEYGPFQHHKVWSTDFAGFLLWSSCVLTLDL